MAEIPSNIAIAPPKIIMTPAKAIQLDAHTLPLLLPVPCPRIPVVAILGSSHVGLATGR
jgi:hypothetical protein